jgi:hypothetical protein
MHVHNRILGKEKDMSKIFLISVTLVISAISLHAQSVRETRLSLSFTNATLKQVLQFIESKTIFRFQGNANDIESVTGVTIAANDESLEKILQRIFSGHNLTYSQSGTSIIIKKVARSTPAKNSNKTIHGTVKSRQNGETIIGATVTVQQSKTATATNEYGFFSLTLPPGNYSLQLSAVGMKSELFEINLLDDVQKAFYWKKILQVLKLLL